MPTLLVALDADGTIWSHKDISSCQPPFRKLAEDTLVDSKGNVVRLYPGVRELLRRLKSAGILIALVTWNRPEPVMEALRKLEILEYFDYIKAEPHPRKHEMILSLLEEAGLEVSPDHIVYVDDRDIHLKDILGRVGQVDFVYMWRDVKSHGELLAYILRRASALCGHPRLSR
ncbi:MAG: magnesium-dependent phosphatase-1 [Thermoproteota archaeon]|nr:MAG: magnesium-dependent phosphatase-1 [Candidatus Korarchaeota archaeon]